MAVVSVTREPKGHARSGSWNRLWQRNYVLTYRVECDGREDGPVTIRTASGYTGPAIPQIGNSYYVNATEKDDGSFLEQVDYECESAGPNPEHATWLLTCRYGPYDANLFPENPVDWPLKLVFNGTRQEKVVWADKDGNPIRNSAKVPFEEPVTVDDSRSTITVTRNELISSFDFLLTEYYRDTVNDALWNGFAPRTVKIGTISTSEPQYNSVAGVWYYAVTYPFEVNRDEWKKSLLDQGLQQLDASSPPRPVPIVRKGQPITEPTLLDGSGAELATTGTPVFLDFETYTERDFSAFDMNFELALGRV